METSPLHALRPPVRPDKVHDSRYSGGQAGHGLTQSLVYGAVAGLALLLAPAVWGDLHSASKPAPRTDQGWKTRADLLNQRIKDQPDARLLFIGDSITQGWEGAGKEVWEKYYGNRKAVNLGIGGDRTQHVLWRLEHGNLDGVKPAVAVVMIGTNNSNGEDNTPGQIADGVRAIVAKLRMVQPQMKILLLAIFPRSENFSPQRGKIAQVNQVLRRWDDGQHVFFIDVSHRFLTDEGLLPVELMPDYLHLSPQGYAIWAEAMEPTLARLLETPVAAASDLTGEWIWKIRGPDGNDLEAPLILKSEAGRISGRFARGEDRWLEIEEARRQGNEVHWTVRRDRASGGTMVYKMSASLQPDGSLKGRVETEMDGAAVSQDWSARRK